jgi:cytochrome c oxidase subunit 2
MALGASGARAEQAYDWQLGFQPAASVVRERIDFLHNVILLPIITVISLFVLGLLLWVMIRFNAKRNPVPSKISHNTALEIAWTLVPILILVVIAIPSFKLLYFMDKAEKADMTLKVSGHQWYWSYEYPDQNNVAFDSRVVTDAKGEAAGNPRLLQTDFPVVLPVNTTIRVLVTGTDVIHSWFMPSFGVQEYAVVGRNNESWVKIDREGTFYGQCNQICGVNHPFMPIEVKAVSSDKFKTWAACSAAASSDQARAECYKPVATADAEDRNAARVAANAPAAGAVKQ